MPPPVPDDRAGGRGATVGDALAAIGEGARLLTADGIRTFVLAPIALSLLLFVPAIGWVMSRADQLAAHAIAALPEWLGFLDGVLTFGIGLVAAVAGAWLIALAAIWLVAPLLGPLAERVARHIGEAGAATGNTPRNVLVGVGAGLVREWQKLRYLLPRLLLVLLITLVPGINLLAPLAWLLFGAWFVVVEFTDFAADNAGLPLSTTLAALRANRAAALVFGGIFSTLLAVPLAGIVVLPLAAAAGTVLWVRRLAPRAGSTTAG